MKKSNLKEVVQTKLKENKMSASDLERKAGLSAASVRKILLGDTINPTLETLSAIADFFGCSIDELVGKSNIISKPLPDHVSIFIPPSIEWKGDLMEKIVHHISLYLEKTQKTVEFKTMLPVLIEIYNYFMAKKDGNFDESFQDWYLQKFLEEESPK